MCAIISRQQLKLQRYLMFMQRLALIVPQINRRSNCLLILLLVADLHVEALLHQARHPEVVDALLRQARLRQSHPRTLLIQNKITQFQFSYKKHGNHSTASVLKIFPWLDYFFIVSKKPKMKHFSAIPEPLQDPKRLNRKNALKTPKSTPFKCHKPR